MEEARSALRHRHGVLICMFALVIPILTHHLLQGVYVAIEVWYTRAALNDTGEFLFAALLEILWLIIGFCKALSLLGVIGVYAMNRLRLPKDARRQRWMRWLLPVLLLPYLASYWLAFAFDDPHWEDLGYLSLTILSNWALDLLVMAIALLLIRRYARGYRTQQELSPQGRILPRRSSSPLLRLFLWVTVASFAVRGAITLWNTVLLIANGYASTVSDAWYSVIYPWLLLIAQHLMIYLLLVWVAHDTEKIFPAEQDRFQK